MATVIIDISDDNDGTGEPIEITFAPSQINDISIAFGTDLSLTMSGDQFERLATELKKWWESSPV